VRRLDRQRLGLEELVEETLRILQHWEAERLAAVKTGVSVCCVEYTSSLKMTCFRSSSTVSRHCR
jgi:hypothetical protein